MEYIKDNHYSSSFESKALKRLKAKVKAKLKLSGKRITVKLSNIWVKFDVHCHILGLKIYYKFTTKYFELIESFMKLLMQLYIESKIYVKGK